MAEFLQFLIENDLVTIVFVIGALAFIGGLIGKFGTFVDLSAPVRAILALFGVFLMVSSVGGWGYTRVSEDAEAEVALIAQGTATSSAQLSLATTLTVPQETTQESSMPMETIPDVSVRQSVTRREVDSWTVGEVSIEAVQDCLASVHAGPRPFVSFSQGEEIPPEALVATNYFEAGRQWNEFPVIPVCHNGSWGLFESSNTYVAPYEGAYWMIMP